MSDSATAPQAWLNGKFVPAHEAVIPVTDAGFVQGTTVAEQLRTFNGQLFRLQMHLDRLWHSLAVVGVEPGFSREELSAAAEALAKANHALLAPGHDLGLAMVVTPGVYSAMVAAGPQRANVCLHTFPLRFELWANKYRDGESLSTTNVEQVPTACWPPELKCRSRMHYYLADRQAAQRFPGSRALLTDREGTIVEATSANVVLYRQDTGLIVPPSAKTLPGISMAVLFQLADQLAIPVVERDLRPADVATADEVFLTSTSPCIIPVVRFNGQPIGPGHPGATFSRLMSAWNGLAGLDIMGQAQQMMQPVRKG